MSNSSNALLARELERHERKLLLAPADQLEPSHGLQLLGQDMGVGLHHLHDVAVARAPVADEVVVLREHHRRPGREVQGEGGVGLAQVVLLEHEVRREVGLLTEDQPADAGVDQAELVPGDVDRPDLLEPEVPLRVGIEERPHEATAGTVDVQGHVEPALVLDPDQEVVDADDVVLVAGECGAQHGGDADRVLVDVRLDVLRPDRVLGGVEGHDAWLDVEVAAELLPDDVHIAAEHQVGTGGRQSSRLAAFPPVPLQGQAAQHDGFGRPLGAGPGRRARSVEEVGEHPDAALLDLRGPGVLGMVDEVSVQVAGDDLPCLRLHPCRHEGRQVAAGLALDREVLGDQSHRVRRGHAAVRELAGRHLHGQESVAEQPDVVGTWLVAVLGHRLAPRSIPTTVATRPPATPHPERGSS